MTVLRQIIVAGRGPSAPSRRARRRRLRKSGTLNLGVAILAGVLLISFMEPLLHLPAPNLQNYADVDKAPSLSHFFGTDSLGRDVFARTLAAARLDLTVAVAVTLVSLLVGVCIGSLAGYLGGHVGNGIMRFADAALAFPFLILVLGMVAIVGPGLLGIYIGVPLVGWAVYARLAMAEMLVVREKEYILAARTLGYSTFRVLTRHALPNVWRSSVAYCTSDIVLSIMLLATLSYLGLGVQPPRAEWGAIIYDGQSQLLTAWWISTLPGLVVVLVATGLSLLGDGLSETFDEAVA